MLTIENIHKLVGRRFGTDMEWMVSKAWEEPGKYNFTLDRWNLNDKIDYTTKISIVRFHGAEMGMSKIYTLYRFLYEGYDTDNWGSHLDFKDMKFVLESFEVIVKRIPR